MVITDYLVDKMVEKKIISENKEFYIYGLNNGFMIIANFLTALFLSYIVLPQFYSFVFKTRSIYSATFDNILYIFCENITYKIPFITISFFLHHL